MWLIMCHSSSVSGFTYAICNTGLETTVTKPLNTDLFVDDQYLPADKWLTYYETPWNRSCMYIKFVSCIVWCISRLPSSSIASLIWFCLLKICFSCQRYFVFPFFKYCSFFCLFWLLCYQNSFTMKHVPSSLCKIQIQNDVLHIYSSVCKPVPNHKNVSEMLTLCICYRMLILFQYPQIE